MCQFCPSARQTLVTALGGLGAISRLVNVWFVKPGLNGLNSSSPLSIVHIEPTHESLRYSAFSQPYAWCEWRKYPCYFLFPLNWEHKAIFYNEFFVSLFCFCPFFRRFPGCLLLGLLFRFSFFSYCLTVLPQFCVPVASGAPQCGARLHQLQENSQENLPFIRHLGIVSLWNSQL